MLRNIASTLVLMLSMVTSGVSAQEFNNFRMISENVPAGAGFVTSIALDTESQAAQISFLNVAGLSKVYDVVFTASDTIKDSVPVFMPPAGFSDYQPPAIDLEGVEFFKGSLVDPEDGVLPAHWFRLTKYDGRWSGAFRIADRIYAINRNDDNLIVNVRYTPSTHHIFQPSQRVKISAVIDEEYTFTDGTDNIGHLHALESIHVMDGLLADTLGMTLLLEQVIFQPTETLTSPTDVFDLLAGANSWLESSGTAFGLTDNIATMFFRGTLNSPTDKRAQSDNGLIDESMIVLGYNTSYQFASAHYFGRLLGIPDEPMTLQDWAIEADEALPSAHWTEQQKEFLDSNPPPAELTQRLSYDAPDIATPPPEEINVVDSIFVNSEYPEANQQPPLLNDDGAFTDNDGLTTGGGGYSLDPLLLMLLTLLLGNAKRHLHRDDFINVTRRSH